MYVPGHGDQQLLVRGSDNPVAPATGLNYPIVTAKFWSISCLPAAQNNVYARPPGEGFLATAPDGTRYYFDWLVYFAAGEMMKPGDMAGRSAARPGPAAATRDDLTEAKGVEDRAPTPQHIPWEDEGPARLARSEVWILPSKVVDRYGNSVNYTYDPANPRNVTRIEARDSYGVPEKRAITLSYVNNMIDTVSDGSDVWHYSYHGANLDAVLLPDGSRWDFSAFDSLLASIKMQNTGGCSGLPLLNSAPVSGRISHPSGATAIFDMAPQIHGRSRVPTGCMTNLDGDAPGVPRFFATYSLTGKHISGPGLGQLDWTYAYESATATASFDTDTSAPTTKHVEMSAPDSSKTRYTFGNQYNATEGRLLLTEEGWDGSSTLRSVSQRYRAFDAGPYPRQPGTTAAEVGDGNLNALLMPVDQRVTQQQGVTFTWEVAADVAGFDEFARPRLVTRSSTLGMSRVEATIYTDVLGKWILGQLHTVTSGGKTMLQNNYNLSSGVLDSVEKFGLLQQSMTYNTDGTVATQSDGLGKTTTFTNYKRGIPQNVRYADGSTESAVVKDDGTIASITDAMMFQTSFDYLHGRLSKITYPTAPGDPVWNVTTIGLTQINSAEFDMGPGHWRQDVTTGNSLRTVYLDALLRPAYTATVDIGNPAGSQAVVRNAYDHAGRTSFTSYPRRQFGPAQEPGQPVPRDAALGLGIATQYDALGRLTGTAADSELGILTTATWYDAGFRTSTRDARGNVSTTSFQAFDTPSEDAVTGLTAPEGLIVAIDRDLFGKPRSISRSDSRAASPTSPSVTRRYVYDGYERLCKTIEPETGATVQQLDNANNVSWRAPGTNLTSATVCDQPSVAGNARISFGYDVMNRLRTTSFGDGSATIGRDYWPDGQPKIMSSSGAVWTMNYNSRRLPTTQSLAFEGQTYALNTTYNANGHPVQLDYPVATNSISNRSASYDPDALGRPTHVSAYASNIAYHPSGAISGFTYGNGKLRSMSQNARGLPQVAQDAGVMSDVYGYDENANVIKIADQINAGLNGANTSRVMGYDGLDRLKDANAPGIWGNANYNYDVLDNIRTSTVGGRASTYHYGARNLLDDLQSTASGFNYAYGYDNRGNVTSRGGQGFGFDLGNRLTTAANLDSYVYDGFGRRIKTAAVDGTVTISVYSPAGQLLYTRRTGGPNPAQSTQYIYLHSHQIAEVKK
jgi:hypothetical protein